MFQITKSNVLYLSLGFISHVISSPIALPAPQAVTALISPVAPQREGCTGDVLGVFGIAVMNVSISTSRTTLQERQVGGGPLRSTTPPAIFTMAAVSQIGDGQVQGGMHTVIMSVPVVSEIGDGQVQAPEITTTTTGCATLSTTTSRNTRITRKGPPAAGRTNTNVNANANARMPGKPPTVLEQACGISVRPTPIQSVGPNMLIPPSHGAVPSSSTSSAPPARTIHSSLVSCQTNSTLQLLLHEGVLKDGKNRTGYIASNYQFQFDGPPQSGALYTAGWSVCSLNSDSDGTGTGAAIGQSTLALGGKTTFWQCLSGDFYNLYTEDWAAQCSPVELRVVRLVQC